MEKDKDSVQTNVNLAAEDVKMVTVMMAEDVIDNRSAFMRRLVRMEYARRHSKPNPDISVEKAIQLSEVANG